MIDYKIDDYNNWMVNLYSLALHETSDMGDCKYTRVPGGWVFESYITNTAVFIPYDNEFDKNEIR